MFQKELVANGKSYYMIHIGQSERLFEIFVTKISKTSRFDNCLGFDALINSVLVVCLLDTFWKGILNEEK